MERKPGSANFGAVVSVRGSVVEMRFERQLPAIYSLLRAEQDGRIAIKVLAQLDARHVRGIALTPTQGLARGTVVEDTGGPLTSSDPVLVRSAFELPSQQRAAIQQVLNDMFSAAIHIRFETAPAVISGIELLANGRKVAWSIANYLVSLEVSVGELLKEKERPDAKAAATTEAKAGPKPEAPEAEAESR